MAGSGKDIFRVFPTPMAMQQMKAKLQVAEKGHKILKKKNEVLDMRFRKVAKEIIKTKENMGEIMKEASFHLAEAKFVTGEFNHTVLNGVTKAHLKVKSRVDNVAGVKLQVYESYTEGNEVFGLTGLAKGGERLLSLKQTYIQAIEVLVELATLQTTFKLLDEVIKSLNRRVNSLEQMYIPKCKRTIKYIEDEMDDSARQDFFRLKKVQNMKRREMAKKQAEEYKALEEERAEFKPDE